MGVNRAPLQSLQLGQGHGAPGALGLSVCLSPRLCHHPHCHWHCPRGVNHHRIQANCCMGHRWEQLGQSDAPAETSPSLRVPSPRHGHPSCCTFASAVPLAWDALPLVTSLSPLLREGRSF